MSKFNLSILFILLFSISGDCQELTYAEKNGQYGFFLKKKMVLNFQYDTINQQVNGSYAVRKGGKWGLVSNTGIENIQCKYDLLYSTTYHQYIAAYNGLLGVIDSTGTVVLDFLFDKIDHVEEDKQALVKYQGKWCWYFNGSCEYDDTEFIFVTPDTMPLFPGCQQRKYSYEELRNCSNEKMYKYIFEILKYPVEARRKGIQGAVIVQFIVTEAGIIQDPIIRRGVGGGCNEEVLRMVNEMPNWIPGVQDGKNVATKFTLPVKFVLQR